MFVIIQCLDNLDQDLDPKEKVAQVSFQRDVDLSQYIVGPMDQTSFIITNSYLIFVIFFTRAKFLETKIYTEKRQFFALNL